VAALGAAARRFGAGDGDDEGERCRGAPASSLSSRSLELPVRRRRETRDGVDTRAGPA